MADHHIKYRGGYKYQLVKEYKVEVSVVPEENIQSDYIDLNTEGLLTIKKGYAWDGPSGPTIDTKNFMRGSLVHDALYQLMRYKLIEGKWREAADDEMRRICLEDGMCRLRAWYVHRGVRLGAGFAASPEQKKEIITAP